MRSTVIISRRRLRPNLSLAILAAAAVVCCEEAACKAQDPPTSNSDGAAVLHRLLEARRSMTEGRFEISATCPSVNASYSEYGKASRRYSICMNAQTKEQKVFFEWSHPNASWRAITLVNGESAFSDPGAWAIHATLSQKRDAASRRYAFDVRVLGLSCRPLFELRNTTLDNVIKLKGVEKIHALSGVQADGTEFETVTLDNGRGRTVKYRCISGETPSVSHVTVTDEATATVASLEIESQVIRAADSPSAPKVSFPKRLKYSRTRNGQIELVEDAVVEARLESLDDAEFELTALPIAEGRRVIDDQSRVMVWTSQGLRNAHSNDTLDPRTGNYLLSPGGDRQDNRGTAVASSGINRLLVIGNLAIAGIVVACLLVRRVVRRRKS